MADWANLPNDLIAHIANRVKVIEDFIAFGAVCISWRIAATKVNFDLLSPQVPSHELEFCLEVRVRVKSWVETKGRGSSHELGWNWRSISDLMLG
uniref:F-box domain-containing protein n=1 Tax=Solanum lycopersicum TaxID=4081 RepID=A0A3Q7HUK1_SOLLC